jgi:hypothetical protein
MILICNNFSSIAQSFQLISLAQVQKRGASGHRSVAWWIDKLIQPLMGQAIH